MSQTLRAALVTLGCRVNFSESDHLRGALQAAGYHLVEFDQEADLYIVNTCTVTHVADRKSRRLLRQAVRRNPNALVVAVGCYAQTAPAVLRGIAGVDLVVGHEQVPTLLEQVARSLRGRGWETSSLLNSAEAPPRPANPARALVKVQDGCDNRCAYCLVTVARGPARSRPAEEVLAEVRQAVKSGRPEIILTGINLGAYHDPLVGDLSGLARAILDGTAAPRIRFSSIEPQDFPRGLLDLWPNPRLCRHFHLPLQSGCDRTLARMGRRYHLAQVRALIEEIERRIPDVGLTTDIIVGFPGETEEEFAQSIAQIADLPFSELHIFPFSSRPETPAATMPDPVPPTVRRRRCEKMHHLAREKAQAFRRRFLGQTLAVLWDGQRNGQVSGLSDNYLRVVAQTPGNWLGRATPTRIHSLEGTLLRGEILASAAEPRDTGQIAGFVV